MKPVVLCILDGVGFRKSKHGNAVKMANMPTFHKLLKKYPHSLLEASGRAVGLPKDQMGTSEVGHFNIGSGRLTFQPLEMINQAIENKTFYTNQKLTHFMKQTKKLHILGLLSDGGIHSTMSHLFALIDVAKEQGIEELYIHVFTDGRDTLRDTSLTYLKQLEDKLRESELGKIASISGRYYAMDRDNNYDRIKPCYDVLVKDREEIKDYETYIKQSYENNIYDEFLKPIKINNEGTIHEGDSLITFNFRPDRLRELFASLTNKNFNQFETKITTKLLTMFSVSDEVIYDYLFEHPKIDNFLGPYVSSLGLKQLRIAETEKYAHVTYFFDGGKEFDLEGEKKILIPSPKVKTYDLKPEMSAKKITDTLIKEFDKNDYDLVILNYANGDMVGHTGDLEATIKALEILDHCLEKLYNKIEEKKGILVITADHGNSDYMLDKNNNKITSHSMSKVPFLVTDSSIHLNNGTLSDIAPTLLSLMGQAIPQEMTGHNLITKKRFPIFKMISFSIFFVLLFIYSYRFVYYYRVEHPKKRTDFTLKTEILSHNEIVTNGLGLHKKDSNYTFYGEVDNNYVSYSNQLWRVLNINEDGTITLVSDDIITSLAYSYETEQFQDSYVYSWLQSYYNTLNQPDNYLKEQNFCVHSGKTKEENCSTVFSSKIGLLSYYNYIEAGANHSYLNIGKYFWTLTPSENNRTWYVFSKGGINDKSYEGDTYYSYGIRPVITLKEGINYNSGSGTVDDPYLFEEKEKLGIGSYIQYSNYLFRIIKKNDTSFDLAMNTSLDITHHFSNNSSIYKMYDYNSLYSYLNNTFYSSLDSSLLVDHISYTGTYGIDTKYDYQSIYDSEVTSKVGLLNVADLFTTTVNNYYTSTPYNKELIIAFKENGFLYSADIKEEKNIRPVISITNQIEIISGSGTKDDPYIVGGK